MQQPGFKELLIVEENLVRYNASIVEMMSRRLIGKASILEFGAGIGTLALEWRKRTGIQPECLEIDTTRLKVIRDRGFLCHESLSGITKKFDGIYSSNVFEHIENDVSVLEELHGVLSDGGILAIYVPAFMSLFSEIDSYLDHQRRYRRQDLMEKVERAGFSVLEYHYVDCIGFLAWYGVKLLGKRGGPGVLTDGRLRLYDRWIYPVSSALDRFLFRRFFGKNLILIARK